MTILEAAAALRARKVSSAELTEQALRAIERDQPRLNAYITVMAEHARAQARRADAELAAGRDRGPLHGVPIAVKDLFDTRGVRTTGGSKLFADRVPDRDAAVVERLEAAGAVLTGKTGLHELAYGVTSNNPHFGPVRNPVDPERVPGGSSGGSGAAVAAGMVAMAMGTDTGGSIRIPASYCGTVGLKPTFGRVSRYGCLPLGNNLDHMGPLTRTVRDTAVTMNVLAGYDRRDASCSRRPVEDYLPPAETSPRGLRIGVPENFYFDRVDEDVAAAVRGTLAEAGRRGADLVPVRVPDIEAINAVGRVILLAEVSALMEPHWSRRADFGADVLALIDQGRLLPATDYINAQRLRGVLTREFLKLFDRIDVLATPTAPITAPKIGETTVMLSGQPEDVRLATTRFVRAINVLGLPALSLPCGHDRRNLPVGLQLVGKPFSEAMVLRAGAALETTA